MRILVVGANGQLAQSLIAAADDGVTEIIALGRPALDLADPGTIAAALGKHRPDLVINAAAYTAVDQAETDEAEAFAINAQGPGALAEAAAAGATPLIHVSTDYVFAGDGAHAYTEDDPVAPTSAYGRSKLAGEVAVVAAQPKSLIVRTAWVVSPYGKNFCKTMLRLAGSNPKLRVVADQVGSPTYAPHLARALLGIADQIAARPDDIQWGTYHLANSGYASWYDVAVATMEAARENDLPAAPVEAITTAEFPTPAQRPANSRLDCSKARSAFGVALPDWQDGIRDCVAQLAADNKTT